MCGLYNIPLYDDEFENACKEVCSIDAPIVEIDSALSKEGELVVEGMYPILLEPNMKFLLYFFYFSLVRKPKARECAHYFNLKYFPDMEMVPSSSGACQAVSSELHGQSQRIYKNC